MPIPNRRVHICPGTTTITWGPNPNANWCVTKPWFDWVFGTREHYVASERERRDRNKVKSVPCPQG